MLIRWNFRNFFFKSREFVIFVPRDTLMIELVHVNVLFIYLFILPGFIAVPIYVYLSPRLFSEGTKRNIISIFNEWSLWTVIHSRACASVT